MPSTHSPVVVARFACPRGTALTVASSSRSRTTVRGFHATCARGSSIPGFPRRRAAGASDCRSPNASSKRTTTGDSCSRTRSRARRSRLSFSDPPLAVALIRMTLSTLLEEKLTAGLNPAQREAVLHVNGPLLVLAGAGSGKTRVLTSRIARLIDVEGVDPRQILAVTFTNKAAGEMRERIGRLLGTSPAGMWAGTFHSIGARMLRAGAHLVARTPAFTIYDQDDSLAVVKRLMERHRVSPKQFTPRAIQSTISDAKNRMVMPSEFAHLAMDPFAKAVATIYASLGEALQLANAVDFDDLLVLPVRVLQNHPDKLAQYRQRFRYILVDEYQDTNRAQYELIRLLGGEHGNVCVVGDDDQSIYGWRGADIRNILDFNKDFPNATVVRLEENYRSTPQILDLANVVISANTARMGMTLRATHNVGEKPTVVRSLDERDEADFVVNEILTRRSSSTSYRLDDFAVLYRTNSQSRALEDTLNRRAIACRLIGAVRFYDRREI